MKVIFSFEWKHLNYDIKHQLNLFHGKTNASPYLMASSFVPLTYSSSSIIKLWSVTGWQNTSWLSGISRIPLRKMTEHRVHVQRQKSHPQNLTFRYSIAIVNICYSNFLHTWSAHLSQCIPNSSKNIKFLFSHMAKPSNEQGTHTNFTFPNHWWGNVILNF